MRKSFCPSHDITFARGFGGGTYFRSKSRGAEYNGIKIIGVQNSASVTLTVEFGGKIETYSAIQSLPTAAGANGSSGSPGVNGILGIREQVNKLSNLITMPARGNDTADSGGVDAEFMTSFSTYLSGGDGLPLSALHVDTGEKFTYVHNNYEENDFGIRTVANKIYEWKGKSEVDGAWFKR